MKINRVLYWLVVMFLITGILPTTGSNQRLNSIINGIRMVSPFAALIFLLTLENERNSSKVYIKHLRWSLDFTEKNMEYFREELRKTKNHIGVEKEQPK